MLSLVVVARDEEERIEACLASVPFARERLVLDSGSVDRTVAVARSCGARVVRTDWPGHVAQKNRALAMARGPWVLSLDADERLAPAAAEALHAAIEGSCGGAVAFSFPRLSTWLGTALHHGRWHPDRKIRVVRKGHGRWVGDDPHDRLQVDGDVVALHAPILHDPYRDLGEHLATIDTYTKLQASAMAERGVRASWWDVALRPPLHFVDAYLRRRGFLDGVPGLAVAGLGATYVLCKWSRVWLLQRGRA